MHRISCQHLAMFGTLFRPMTAWHHLACVVPHCTTAADIEGYAELPEEQQKELQARVDESRGETDELYQVHSIIVSPHVYSDTLSCSRCLLSTAPQMRLSSTAWLSVERHGETDELYQVHLQSPIVYDNAIPCTKALPRRSSKSCRRALTKAAARPTSCIRYSYIVLCTI